MFWARLGERRPQRCADLLGFPILTNSTLLRLGMQQHSSSAEVLDSRKLPHTASLSILRLRQMLSLHANRGNFDPGLLQLRCGVCVLCPVNYHFRSDYLCELFYV